MLQTHINTDNTDFTYQNTTEVGQNIFFTGTGGAGNINTSTYDSGNTRYFHAGSAGVSLQVFINDSLVESISGGSGNIQSIADVKKHVRTENHRYKVSCGFLGLKKCWRDNWVQIWEWGHNRRNATHRAEGQTKSFVLNIPPQSTLKVKFTGSSDSEYKGSVSISLLENTQSIPFKPIDLGGLEGLVEKIPEPLPETPELPEVDSSENTEQGGESSQENTESENTENENPPIVEPETPQFPPVTIEQINNFINFVGELNTFWNANESLQLRDNYTLGDFYADKKMGSPALVSYPYDNFVKKYWVFESINTWIDEFMSSETPEIIKFFKANPKPETRYYNTEYNEVSDLYESSRQDLTYLLQKLEKGA